MEVFTHAAVQMLILFTIMLLGVLARKKHLMGDNFDALLSKLVMTVTLPGMILNSVLGSSNLPDTNDILMMLLYSTITYVAICAFAWIIVHVLYRGVSKPAQGAHAFLIAFGNTGFIGFAVLDAIFGSDAVLYAAIYNIPYNIFMFSVGLLFIASTGEGGASKKSSSIKDQLRIIGKQLISPCLISCFIAMFLAIFGVTDSGFIGQTCNLLGQMTVPAAMLIIGSSLAKMPVKEMLSDKWTYVTTIFRLLVIPLLLFAVCRIFITNPYILAIVVILCAMPAASSGTMMCLAYGGDARVMARGTFLTTVCSLITLPIIAMIVV